MPRCAPICITEATEDAEMPDLLMQQVDDTLASDADFLDIGVAVGDPVQRLLRRGDVVATAGEDDDRRADVLDVHGAPRFELRHVAHQAVADEQLLDDPVDLGLVQAEEAAPPAFEFQETFALGIHLAEQVVVLAEEAAAWVQHLEVHHQMSAVEDATAEVRPEHRLPGAAVHPRAVAHRVGADLAAPGFDRRAVQHDRAGQVGVGRGEQQRRPAALAVADDARLGRGGVLACHLAHELRLGARDVGDRLAGMRIAPEGDETDRMAGGQCDAHLAVGLEPADPGTVLGTRVDDDEGPPGRVDGDVGGRQDPQQHAVARPRDACAWHCCPMKTLPPSSRTPNPCAPIWNAPSRARSSWW